MQRLITLCRRYMLSVLCGQCRREMETKLRELEDLRKKDREHRPQILEQRKAAPKLCDELLALPPAKRKRKIQLTRHRLRSRPLAEELLARCRKRVHHDPSESIHLAELAFEVALTLVDPETVELSGGLAGLADLQALALAHQANAQRVACDFDSANASFLVSQKHLNRGSGDPLVYAEILSLKASYYQTRRLFPLALDLVDKAEELYRSIEEEHLRGRLLVQKAKICTEAGDLQGALRAQLESCSCLDEDREPHIAAATFHNLAWIYCQLGQFDAASRVLADSEEFFQEHVEEGSTIRLDRSWTLAKVAQGLEQFEVAEALLNQVKAGFEQLEISFNVALVLLDLAALYTILGRVDDVAALAEETYAALEAHNLHQEAAQALMVFTTAARRKEAALGVIRKAAELLQRYQYCAIQPS